MSMGIAQQFTQAREAALRSAASDTETTGEFDAMTQGDLVSASVTVLTTDAELYESVRRAVLDQHEISMAADLEQAAELAAAGKCAILITDQAMSAEASAHIIEHLRKLEPALVSIAVGNRGQDSILLGLMSSAAVDRFMLKPITPALARIVIESAGKEYQSRKPGRRNQRTAPAAPAFTMRRPSPPSKRRGRAEEGNAITQPVKVLPSPPTREQPLQAPPEVVAREEALAGQSEDLTVVVPTLDAASPAPPDAQADAAEQGTHFFPSSSEQETETRIRASRLARAEMEPAYPAPDLTVSPFGKTSLPQPSWIVLVAAVAAVGALVWWIMAQRVPDIDPRQLISSNLSAARAALAENQYVEPSERSALHYFSTVLALDPANVEARSGIDRIADHFIESSQALIAQGRFAEAVSALQNVRRVRPEHARVASLEVQLRAKLAQQFPQIRKPTALDAQQVVAAPASASSPGARTSSPDPSPVPRSARTKERRHNVNVRDAEEQQGARPLDERMMTDARQAIERKEFDQARTFLGAALEMGAAPDDVVAVNESLTAAERSVAKVEPPAPVIPTETELRVASAPAAVVAAPPPEPPAELVLVKLVQPRYPNEARLRGIEGWVDLSFVVSAAGEVTEPRVEGSSMKHLFARPALDAVRQWKYQPRPTGGDPAQRKRTRVVFKLQE